MAVISIQRDMNNNVSFVKMISTDSIATVQSANYIRDQQFNINVLNEGVWDWFISDMVLCACSDGSALFTFSDATFSTLVQYGQSGGVINPGLINELAYYAASGNDISGLPTANNGVLVTSPTGVPSISSTLPAGLTIPGYLYSGTTTLSGNYTVQPSDNGKLFLLTGTGTYTVALQSLATYPTDFRVGFKNFLNDVDTLVVTITTPDQIDYQTNIVLNTKQSIEIMKQNGNWAITASAQDGGRIYGVNANNTAAYTLKQADYAQIVEMDVDPTPKVLTIPNNASLPLPTGWLTYVYNRSAGTITFATQGSDTLEGATTMPAFSFGIIFKRLFSSSNAWVAAVIQSQSAVSILGGAINGTIIGSVTPAAITGTTITATTGVMLPTTGGTPELLDYNETANFTLDFTGAITKTVNAKATRIGNAVIININDASDTANGSGGSIVTTQIPSRFRPQNVDFGGIIGVTDNGTNKVGRFQLTVGGTFTMYSDLIGSGFDTTGTVGALDNMILAWGFI